MGQDDRTHLEQLPWHVQLEEWAEQGVKLLTIRRGESRHPVVFVECGGARYAIKETTPRMAEREIGNFQQIHFRGIPALMPVGWVYVPVAPIALDMPSLGGITQYISGDRGYTVTRLAPRVIPHVMLYHLPLKRRTKRRILSAIAILMVEQHEHGVYWGDPSLANVLIRIDGRSILAIMADAETTELFPDTVSDGLREQDLAMFGESLAWQAEDLRQARGLPEDQQVLDDADHRYFLARYRWLKREHARVAHNPNFGPLYQVDQMLQKLNSWSMSLLDMTGHTVRSLTTVLPGWYQNRIYELLHITMPRNYARRFYNLILGHQTIMAREMGGYVSVEDAAKHWYTFYHMPAIILLRRILTKGQDPMKVYFAVMDHKWKMSEEAQREIPLDEAIIDWAVQHAITGKIGAIDPALLAKWMRELEPEAQVLEPPLIASEVLEPLLSTQERPLVRLDPPALEQKLPEILENQPGTRETDFS